MSSQSTQVRSVVGGRAVAWLLLFGIFFVVRPLPGALPLLWAQTAESGSATVSTPSRVRAAELDGEVLVTWRDAAGYEGDYRVWRSQTAFESGAFEESSDIFLAGTVSSSIESLIDRPAEPGTYYYAVTNDLETTDLIEQRNFLPRPVRIAVTAEQAQTPVTVRLLSVTNQNGTALLRFEPSRHGRRLAVYAATEAIAGSEDLQRAVRLGVIDSKELSYRDYPIPGVPTYYAVLDAEQVITGDGELVPQQNTTVEPIRIALGSVRRGTGAPQVGSQREAPIPILRMPWLPATEAYTLDLSRTPSELDPETQAALDAILTTYGVAALVPPEPTLLPGDRNITSSRDGSGTSTGLRSSLATVLAGPFSRTEWSEAETQLSNLLTIASSADHRARVQFYRGQCLYFLGRFNEASLSFVDAREQLFAESQLWLDAALRAGETIR